jgi:hypothetical protein
MAKYDGAFSRRLWIAAEGTCSCTGFDHCSAHRAAGCTRRCDRRLESPCERGNSCRRTQIAGNLLTMSCTLAIMHMAMSDAINACDPAFTTYLPDLPRRPGASTLGAAHAAAEAVLAHSALNSGAQSTGIIRLPWQTFPAARPKRWALKSARKWPASCSPAAATMGRSMARTPTVRRRRQASTSQPACRSSATWLSASRFYSVTTRSFGPPPPSLQSDR